MFSVRFCGIAKGYIIDEIFSFPLFVQPNSDYAVYLTFFLNPCVDGFVGFVPATLT